MPVNDWSESIVVLELNDEPTFSEDIDAIMRRLIGNTGDPPDVVINFRGVTRLNSSNLAQLLRLRKHLLIHGSRLSLCTISDSVWSIFITTGLDQMFQFTEDISTSLASLQICDDSA